MTNENMIKQLKRLIPSLQYADDVNAVKGAIKALSQEPCDDAISRDAVIKILEKYNLEMSKIAEDVSELPSVTQKCEKCAMNGSSSKYCDNCKSSRHKGHWIPIYQGDEIINYHCSECELGDTNGSINLYGWDYCRRCGAEMESEQNE